MLKKLILPILVLSTSFININALDDGDVRIEANLFEANDRERVSIFSGSVKITKGKDVISSSIAKIYFDKKINLLNMNF